MPSIKIPFSKQRNKPILIHFHDENFSFSIIQSFILNKIDGVNVKTKYIKKDKNSFSKYNVSQVPTIVFVLNEKEILRWHGVVSCEDIRDTIDPYL